MVPRKADGRIACADMQCRRNYAGLERAQDLDEARDAGSRRGVAEVRLHRAQEASAAWRACSE